MGEGQIAVRLRKHALLIIGASTVLMIAAAADVYAGIWNRIEGMVTGRIEISFQVNDSAGGPIDGATLWLMGNEKSRPDLKLDDLSRLVRRYSADADFVFANKLHPNLIILHTDRAGKARLQLDESYFGHVDILNVYVAAMKRGFDPVVRAEATRAGSKHNAVFSLQRLGDQAASPLLDEFDRLRGDTERQLQDGVNQHAAAELSASHESMRRIATQLEQQGRLDDAAAVYYGLANLPSIDITRDSGGKPVSKGYTSGFDAHSPSRVADRAKAWELNRSHPWLEFERMRERYVARGLMVFDGKKNSEIRRAFLADAERMIAESRERIWPDAFSLLWRAYNAENDFSSGCAALNRYHAFEPSIFTAAEWWDLLDLFSADVRLRGGSVQCALSQLPART